MPPGGKRSRLSGGELVTAFIRSPHGVKGFMRVESASGETGHLSALPSVLVRLGRDDGQVFAYDVEETAGSAAAFLMKFAGIDTPEDAKLLSGAEILVERDKACPLREGEVYVRDLCQCDLVYGGSAVGRIIGVTEGGGGDLLEVALPEGRRCFVPFQNAFIGDVNPEQKTVCLLHRWILDEP
ncbi:MAG: 16S rRNA processing protein RimM [Spirochaetes bacterium]|uniref:Ribosome maturation factor RimM n=1 Tax=Candidatus Avitreponema avistercoris TaxID=2840705 RepID=A0A9D9HHA5_9SPIR|nr:16S rRNA processing protein RimM [Candidatus Avitreponema avistercoris]